MDGYMPYEHTESNLSTLTVAVAMPKGCSPEREKIFINKIFS